MLTINNLAFERNNVFLFNQINCSLNAGELLQIRGENGSGKSTLLRVLAGFVEPHEGNILWQGQSILQQRDEYQQDLHYIGHQNGIKTNLTVLENLHLSQAVARVKSDPQRMQNTIQKIGLGRLVHSPAAQLSAGQSRRVSLARLLLRSYRLWILDEPTTALDVEGQQLLITLLNQHLADGGMAIVATHQVLPVEHTVKTIQLGAQS